jgi:hypothetical protein
VSADLTALFAEYDALSERRNELVEAYDDADNGRGTYFFADEMNFEIKAALAEVADGLVKALRGECYQLPTT